MNNNIKIDFAYKLQFSIDEITLFIKENWLRETPLSIREFYDWQFLQSKANKNLDHSILAILDGKIVGFLGLNKRAFFLNKKYLNGAELTTWIISNKYRRKGFAKGMIEFIKKNFDIAYGANITIDALKVYLRLDFFFIREIDRVFKIFSYDKIQNIFNMDITVKKIFSKKNPDNYSNYRLINFDSISLMPKYDGFDRSIEYLKWRYQKHPYYKYQVLEILGNNKENYIIFRTEKITEDIKVMIIVDILANCNNFLNLSGIDKFALDHNIDFIEFYSTNKLFISNFVINNYISSKDFMDFIRIPYLYNPIEDKESNSYSLIYFGKSAYIKDLINYSNILITKGDCDLDRPNCFYLKKMEYLKK